MTAYNRLVGYFTNTNEHLQLTDGTVPSNAYAYIVTHWNIAGSALTAIKAAHPAAKVLAYQNLGGMIAGPHTNSRPTTLVTQEEAVTHGTSGNGDWRAHLAAKTITTSTNVTPPVFTTSAVHGLVAGDVVAIAGHSVGSYNGSSWVVASAPTTTTFTVTGMTAAGAGTGGTAAEVAVFSDFTYLQAANVSRADWRTQAASHFATIAADGFHGVMFDDVNMFPGHGGTGGVWSEFPTDNGYRDAVTAAMASLATAARLQGLLVVPNVGMDPWDTNHYAGYTTMLSANSLDVICREFWHHWNNLNTIFDTPNGAWAPTQQILIDAQAAGKAALLNTYPLLTRDDTRSIRYGLASFYLEWDGSTNSGMGYDDGRPLSAYGTYRSNIGTPTGAKTTVGGGYMRVYTGGVAIVNPSASSQAFTLGSSYLDPSGASVSSVTLAAATGMVLESATPPVPTALAYVSAPPVPLRVRLDTAKGSWDVTNEAEDLTFRSVAPRGFASASVTLRRRIDLQPDDIARYGRMVISDGQTSEIVWEGLQEQPERGAGPDGQSWTVGAVGPATLGADRAVPLCYIDRRMDANAWTKFSSGAAELRSATVAAGDDPNTGVDALILTVPTGTNVVSGSSNRAVYTFLQETGQKLAFFNFSHDDGVVSTVWRLRAYSSAGGTAWRDDQLNTAATGTNVGVIGTDWTAGDNLPVLRMQWTGAANATGADDVFWCSVMGLYVGATRYGQDGAEKLTGYSSLTDGVGVLASDVVADLLGRGLLPKWDGPNAFVQATSYRIPHLVYPDGATPESVLDDLMEVEPGFYWAVWERNDETQRYRFVWLRWPTAVRYETPLLEFVSPASAADQYNLVRVRYRDPVGRIKLYQGSATVQELADAGLSRSAYIDLGDEIGVDAANPAQVAAQFLAEHANPPNAGTLTVAEPIMDLLAGRYVQPWEIRPGQLIRVRGVQAETDALNPADRDGVTVFRVASTEYLAATATATLELDSYSYATARALGLRTTRAKITSRQVWPRRR